MTDQVEDVVRYADEEWTIFDHTGEVFDVSKLGLSFTFVGTHCWNGYQLVFLISERRLLLDELRAGLEPVPASLFGVEPTLIAKRGDFPVTFSGLRHAISYSGGLLLAADRICVRGIGSHVVDFARVTEAFVVDGNVVDLVDRSADVERLREAMRQSEAAFSAVRPESDQTWEFDVMPGVMASVAAGGFYQRYFEHRFARWKQLREWAKKYDG